MTALAFVAHDTPRPQGSKRHVGNGVMVESSKGLPTWREAVKSAAMAAQPDGWEPLGGAGRDVTPLFAKVVFTLQRPSSARRVDLAPGRTPDLSKLLRSTEDACTVAGIWTDDARVTDYLRLAKVWWGFDNDALPLPGVVMAVGTTFTEVAGRFDAAVCSERGRVAS